MKNAAFAAALALFLAGCQTAPSQQEGLPATHLVEAARPGNDLVRTGTAEVSVRAAKEVCISYFTEHFGDKTWLTSKAAQFVREDLEKRQSSIKFSTLRSGNNFQEGLGYVIRFDADGEGLCGVENNMRSPGIKELAIESFNLTRLMTCDGNPVLSSKQHPNLMFLIDEYAEKIIGIAHTNTATVNSFARTFCSLYSR